MWILRDARCAVFLLLLLPSVKREEEACLINLLFIVVCSSSSDTKHHTHTHLTSRVHFNLLFDTFLSLHGFFWVICFSSFLLRWNIKENICWLIFFIRLTPWDIKHYVRRDLRYFVVFCRNKLKVNLVYTSNALLSAQALPTIGLCSAHVFANARNCLWLRCLRFFCWNDKYKAFFSINRNRVIMTRNSASTREPMRRRNQSYKNWFVLWSMSKNDMFIKNPFSPKCSIEHSSFFCTRKAFLI